MKHKRIRQLAVYLALTVLGLLFAFPVLWVIWTSLKRPVDAAAIPPVWVFKPQWSNYVEAWNNSGFSRAFFNTVFIGLGTVVVSTLTGVPMGYSLARSPIRGKEAVGASIIVLRMLPEMIFILPLYAIYRRTGLFDTWTGMILAFQILTLPFAVWLLRGFILQVPAEVEDAARVDGCSEWQLLWRVTLPLIVPGIVASAMFTFISVWGALLFPLALGYARAETISVAIANFRGYANFKWPLMAAGSVIATLPQILFFGFIQRHLVAGLTMGSVKA
jgi:ABC-type glycerol-3-phosphate transport system permease component